MQHPGESTPSKINRQLRSLLLHNVQDGGLSLPQQPKTQSSLLQTALFREYPVSAAGSLHSKHLQKQEASNKLNLKDYLHLNSIQRKNKSRSAIRKERTTGEGAALGSANSVELTRNRTPSSPGEGKFSRNEILKDQALLQIQEQIRKLQQLEEYMKRDYRPRDEPKENEAFLLRICNGMSKSSGIHSLLGQEVGEWDGGDMRNRGEGSRRKDSGGQDYFWSKSKSRQLQSPAKMKNGRSSD